MWGLLIIFIGLVGLVFLIGNLDLLEEGIATANAAANVTEYTGFREITNSLVWLAIVGFMFLVGVAWWQVTHRG